MGLAGSPGRNRAHCTVICSRSCRGRCQACCCTALAPLPCRGRPPTARSPGAGAGHCWAALGCPFSCSGPCLERAVQLASTCASSLLVAPGHREQRRPPRSPGARPPCLLRAVAQVGESSVTSNPHTTGCDNAVLVRVAVGGRHGEGPRGQRRSEDSMEPGLGALLPAGSYLPALPGSLVGALRSQRA